MRLATIGGNLFSACAMVFPGGLRVLLLGSISLAAVREGGGSIARLTAAPAGPYRVSGNRILDSTGHPYLVRGTELPPVTLKTSDIAGDGREFGAFSASSLVTIRQRLNMNAVRLPVSARKYERSCAYRARVAEVVRSANRFELLAILSTDAADEVSPPELATFWARCAGEFRSYPNVFFAPGATPGMAEAIRSAGAEQPVIVASDLQVSDRNIIYEATARYATTRTDEDRWRRFGSLSTRAPVLVNDLDPQLDRKSAECAAFPSDPGAATRLVQENLTYFDAHEISWVLSSFRPGKMLTEYRYFNWSKLDDGWTCGEAPSRSGIAMILVAHLWSGDPHGLFAVNHANGGLVLARGGLATAYGPTLADREMSAAVGHSLPWRLGNVAVRVTDSRGIARPARLLYTGAGWANLTFVVPANSAAGPAEVAVVRSDGSRSAARAIVAEVAPGFFSASLDARGAAVGEVVQRAAVSGQTKRFAASECVRGVCGSVPIPLSDGVTTTVRLAGSGIRNAGPNATIRVTVGGIAVPVLSWGAADDMGRDQVTIRLPEEVRDAGETDLAMTVNGVLSNVVRICLARGGSGGTRPGGHPDQGVRPGVRPTIVRSAVPRGFPMPRIPAGNPLTSVKVRLGRYLFYDKRMSVNGTTSCAMCHRQELAFTDGRARAVGATGQTHPRSSMSLVNVAYHGPLNWSNPNVRSLEEQALKPMFGTDPVELGVVRADLLRLIRSDPVYRVLFPRAFPGEANPYRIANVTKALASFERTILSGGSPYDRFHLRGEADAISESAKRGEILFFLDYGGPSCFRCHGGFNFSDAVEFHNTGLYNLPAPLSYPMPNTGIYEHTKNPADVGKFKAPTLRNIALTAPYMHDGSIGTLVEVLDHYAAGGRARENPGKDALVHGFRMTPQNRADLIAFLASLTDEGVIHDPRLGDPWQSGESEGGSRGDPRGPGGPPYREFK